MKGKDEQLVTLLRVKSIPGIGDRGIKQLIEENNFDLDSLIDVILSQKIELRGTKLTLKAATLTHDDAVMEIKKSQQASIDLLDYFSPEYPQRLREIHDPPLIIYRVGNAVEFNDRLVAVVGTRRYTSYGEQVVRLLTGGLAHHGVTVVSGMALGIDAIAHETTLKENGCTVAVLGSGVDVPTPVQNHRLYQQIIQRGCIYSEMSLGSPATRYSFPRRNRIISGLVDGVVVVEAGLKSGSLITAHSALEQGREVWAVPGKITSPFSEGTNRLIQAGAKSILGVEDILEDLAVSASPRPTPRTPEFKSSVEGWVYEQITEPIGVDQLGAGAPFSFEEILIGVSNLELAGYLRSLPGGFVVRNAN